MRRLAITFLATIAALTMASAASAHAHLLSSLPAANGTVPVAPREIVITFTEALEPRFSTIEVQDAAGHRVDTGDAHVPSDNAKRLSVGLKPLTRGTYKVLWHVTSIDTHRSEGTFDFTVAP
jgi:methionine-rich copper-binding protein CopC